MEPIPRPFLSSAKGRLEKLLDESGDGCEWLPPLESALRQLNLSQEEHEKFMIDFKRYAATIKAESLQPIPPEKLVAFFVSAIWSAQVGSSKSMSEEPESSRRTSSSPDEGPEDEGEEQERGGEPGNVPDGIRGKGTDEGAQQDRYRGTAKRYKLLLENIAPFYIEKRPSELGSSSDVKVNPLLQRQISRSLWRQIITRMEPEYRLPTLILKKHMYIRREEPRNLGPGCYDPQYYEWEKMKRFRLTRGQMFSCTPRFPKERVKTDSPDPGAYGNPWERLKRKSFGRVTLLQSGPCDIRGRTFKLTGSALGPGDYEVASSISNLLGKRMSRRGPYDLFSQPDRFDIRHGYFKRLRMNLEPGMYGVHGNMKDRINDRYNHLKGRLSRVSRDANCTGERITISNPMWPSAEAERLPGPGQYDIKEPQYRFTCWPENYWAFNISTDARPKEASDYDNAPTRYRPEQAYLRYCAKGCGFKSVFQSNSQRLDPVKAMVLSERLRGKDIPPMEKHTQ